MRGELNLGPDLEVRTRSLRAVGLVSSEIVRTHDRATYEKGLRGHGVWSAGVSFGVSENGNRSLGLYQSGSLAARTA